MSLPRYLSSTPRYNYNLSEHGFAFALPSLGATLLYPTISSLYTYLWNLCKISLRNYVCWGAGGEIFYVFNSRVQDALNRFLGIEGEVRGHDDSRMLNK